VLRQELPDRPKREQSIVKYLPLIWAGLRRKPARSIFTLLSIVVAFLLFGMLQGMNAGFAKVIADQHLDRLLTDPRVPGGAPMPMSALTQIENVPGVTAVAPRAIFFGSFQQPKNGVFALATDVERWFAVRPEFVIPKDRLEALLTTRAGMVVTPAMLDRYGWKVGDKIPVESRILKQDGSGQWIFDLVGVFDATDNPGQGMLALINYSYFDEARATNRGTADRFIVRIADPKKSAETSAAIDKLFANSTHETRTQSEKEMAQSQMKQVGDINFFTNAIVGAVFFTLLFLTANTMMQSVRERIPEFAVLKTIGFSDLSVLVLVLLEALWLCVVSAMLGLAIATAIFPTLTAIFGGFKLPWIVVAAGLVAAVLVALISASMPAWRVKQLRIVDAIAGR
jgi:putative ABC transport system permease protein